jgi:hypothetical protein
MFKYFLNKTSGFVFVQERIPLTQFLELLTFYFIWKIKVNLLLFRYLIYLTSKFTRRKPYQVKTYFYKRMWFRANFGETNSRRGLYPKLK